MTAPAPAAHLLDGTWVPSTGAGTLGVTDPATGAEIGRIPAGTPQDAAAAVAAGVKASRGWARTAAAERAAVVKAWARLLREHAEEVAGVQTAEGGKPLADSLGGVMAGIGALEQYAELGPVHRGAALQGGFGAADLMVREPRGLVACCTPWNDPVAISLQYVGAALVTGNAVILKPSERTPLSAVRCVELALAAGVPAGVLGLLLGDARAGRPLVADDGVDVVVHVGASATGREVAAVCAARGATALLENGGKDPVIVDAGVDPEWAASQVALGAFANAGQICVAVERVYVHAEVAEPFLEALVRRAEALVVGDPRDPATTMGPLVDDRQRAVVDAHVREAVAAGASLLTGGAVPAGAGSFYPPTVLAGCTDDMLVMREETFGPVAPVRVVASFDEALAAADGTAYGLAATVLTASQEHAQRAWRELRAGTVKVNAVFGGAPGGASHPAKASGQGYGFGPELLDELTRTKAVHLEPAPRS